MAYQFCSGNSSPVYNEFKNLTHMSFATCMTITMISATPSVLSSTSSCCALSFPVVSFLEKKTSNSKKYICCSPFSWITTLLQTPLWMISSLKQVPYHAIEVEKWKSVADNLNGNCNYNFPLVVYFAISDHLRIIFTEIYGIKGNN